MIDALIHRVKIRQSELQVSLASGNAMTWEAYQRMVGEYTGLQTVLDMLDSMLEEEKNRD
jgi:hypothetical protein